MSHLARGHSFAPPLPGAQVAHRGEGGEITTGRVAEIFPPFPAERLITGAQHLVVLQSWPKHERNPFLRAHTCQSGPFRPKARGAIV